MALIDRHIRDRLHNRNLADLLFSILQRNHSPPAMKVRDFNRKQLPANVEAKYSASC